MKNHTRPTCWCPRGGMEGKHDEILTEKAKKCAARNNSARNSSGPRNLKRTTQGGIHYAADGAAYILDSGGHAILLVATQSSQSLSTGPKPAVRPDEDFAGLTCLTSPLSDNDA